MLFFGFVHAEHEAGGDVGVSGVEVVFRAVEGGGEGGEEAEAGFPVDGFAGGDSGKLGGGVGGVGGFELIRNRFSGARAPARLPVRVRTQTG
jgi:hypothetical protein